MTLEQRATGIVQRKGKGAAAQSPAGEPTRPRSFQDLKAWQVCREVRRRMSALMKELPPRERFRLADQVVRASRSATANLAEGYGRFQYPDMVHFARQTRGSLYELLDHLTVALDEGYIARARFDQEASHVQQAIQLVNGFIRFLRRRQEATEG